MELILRKKFKITSNSYCFKVYERRRDKDGTLLQNDDGEYKFKTNKSKSVGLEYIIELMVKNKVSYNEEIIDKIVHVYDIIQQKIDDRISVQIDFKDDYVRIDNYIMDSYVNGVQIREYEDLDEYLETGEGYKIKTLYPFGRRFGLLCNSLVKLEMKNNKVTTLEEFYDKLVTVKEMINELINKGEEYANNYSG